MLPPNYKIKKRFYFLPVAILYYWISLKATYLVLNASTIDNLDKIKYHERDDTAKEIRNSFERSREIGKEEEEPDERDSSDSEIDERGQKRNFRNNCEILWSKKGFSPDAKGGGDDGGDDRKITTFPNPAKDQQKHRSDATGTNSSIFSVQSHDTFT
jgi:hypothetical protein